MKESKKGEEIRASAPGSLMLLGEHAVLHGYAALVAAVDRRIRVTGTPLAAPRLEIISGLGAYEAPLDRLPDDPRFRFVLDAVLQVPPRQGLQLRIESEFRADVGFGSSAAVTAAVYAVLTRLACGEGGAELTKDERHWIFERSRETIRRVQGRGSGADAAASVFGGVVACRMEPLWIQPLSVALPLAAVYCGYKRATAEVVAEVEAQRQREPGRYCRIFEAMDADVLKAFALLIESGVEGLPAFGRLLSENQRRMVAMGLSTPELDEIVQRLEAEPGVAGAKISGSGLGDCAVGLGHVAAPETWPFVVHALNVDPHGVRMESNEIRA